VRRSIVIVAALLAVSTATAAIGQSAKPLPGLDPGGAAVAVIGTGVDYPRPEIARRLARDGEGDPIGHDTAGTAGLPFAAIAPVGQAARSVESNDFILRLPSQPAGKIRLIAVGAGLDDTVALARAIAFIAKTPARIVVLPIGSLAGPRGALLREAAVRFPHLLFIAGLTEATGTGEAQKPGARTLSLANLIVLAAVDDRKAEPFQAELVVDVAAPLPASLAREPQSPGERLAAALAGAAWTAACIASADTALAPAAIKVRLLAAAEARAVAGGPRALAPFCA